MFYFNEKSIIIDRGKEYSGRPPDSDWPHFEK